MKARCSRCGKIITTVHPTKRDPDGSRLRIHSDAYGRTCYGSVGQKVEPKNATQN